MNFFTRLIRKEELIPFDPEKIRTHWDVFQFGEHMISVISKRDMFAKFDYLPTVSNHFWNKVIEDMQRLLYHRSIRDDDYAVFCACTKKVKALLWGQERSGLFPDSNKIDLSILPPDVLERLNANITFYKHLIENHRAPTYKTLEDDWLEMCMQMTFLYRKEHIKKDTYRQFLLDFIETRSI